LVIHTRNIEKTRGNETKGQRKERKTEQSRELYQLSGNCNLRFKPNSPPKPNVSPLSLRNIKKTKKKIPAAF